MCWTGFGWESWFMHAEVLQLMVRLYSSTLFSCENISFLCSLCHILFGFLMIWAPQSSRRKSYIEITSDTETSRMSPRWKSISSLANTWELLVKTNFRYVPCLHYRIARTNAFFFGTYYHLHQHLSSTEIIPDDATHIVLSASGNDLLRLLNEVDGDLVKELWICELYLLHQS